MKDPGPFRKKLGNCVRWTSMASSRSCCGNPSWPPMRTQREARWTSSECLAGTSTKCRRRTCLNWIPSPACEVSATMTRNRSPRRFLFASLKSLSSFKVATLKPHFFPVFWRISSKALYPVCRDNITTAFSFFLLIAFTTPWNFGA